MMHFNEVERERSRVAKRNARLFKQGVRMFTVNRKPFIAAALHAKLGKVEGSFHGTKAVSSIALCDLNA
jgi:hypothetical protein